MLGICGKRIHIPPLPLGIYGVERQRGLSAAAQSRNHDKLPPRYRKGRILEVMRTRLYYLYIVVLLLHLLSSLKQNYKFTKFFRLLHPISHRDI